MLGYDTEVIKLRVNGELNAKTTTIPFSTRLRWR